jgi:hypothetical protein
MFCKRCPWRCPLRTVARDPGLCKEASDITIDQSLPIFQNTLLGGGDHVPLSALDKVLEHKTSITMRGHAPTRVIINYANVPVVAICGLELIKKVRKALNWRIILARPVRMNYTEHSRPFDLVKGQESGTADF